MDNCDLNFGQALDLCKKGFKIAREGWNGKGMFIFLANGNDLTNCLLKDKEPKCNDSICLKTAQNTVTVGWIPSQTDLLAEDWVLVYSDAIELV